VETTYRYDGVGEPSQETRMSEALYEQRGAVALISLNRPENLNSFNNALRLALQAAIARAAADDAIRAVVVTGAGRGFSAGADLAAGEMPTPVSVVHQLENEYGPAILQLAEMPKITIAAIHGFAAGIGVGYALACDLIVMGENAFIQVPFNRIGLVPDGGVCWQLVERVGHRRALEISLEAERVPAARCVQLGLANRAVPDDQVLPAALEWAERVTQAAPIALRETKRVMRAAATATLAQTIRDEAQAQSRCIGSADFKEGVVAVLQKRPAKFIGR
jgi:2-(1,2-epoxy-1,2-dihydrophenyl)acetyl-CoA isomerase